MTKEASIPVLRTIPQHCEKYPAFTQGGERWKVFNAPSNGMEALGVIVRIGRNVYINESRYFLWVELQNTGELGAVVKRLREAQAKGNHLSPDDAVAQVRGGAK